MGGIVVKMCVTEYRHSLLMWVCVCSNEAFPCTYAEGTLGSSSMVRFQCFMNKQNFRIVCKIFQTGFFFPL